MIHAAKIKLAESSFGRVLLHLACLARDGKLRWHWAGMRREFQHLSAGADRSRRGRAYRRRVPDPFNGLLSAPEMKWPAGETKVA